MNTSPRTAALLLSAVTASSLLAGGAAAQEDEITGNWNCSLEAGEQGMSMSASFDREFKRDGTSTLDGSMSVEMPAANIDITLAIVGTGTWRAEMMKLIETMTEVEVTSESENPGPMETMIAQQMQASFAQANQEQTTDIKSLTATTMELDDDGLVTCERIA
jgi:hypothetical protein